MKWIPSCIIAALMFCAPLHRASAAFSSIYVFGDSVSSMTDSPGGLIYYGNRYSNGRVWVEVLAQRQGLTLTNSQNLSFYGHDTPKLLTNASNFIAPVDVATALVVVWVNNADIVFDIAAIPAPYDSSDIPAWTNRLNVTLSNYSTAIQTLHTKGVRAIVAPNAADVTKAPYYNMSAADEAFVRQRTIEFNAAFVSRMNQLQSSLSNLTIIVPDMFTLIESLVAQPTAYGFTNSTGDALDDLLNTSFTGPGTNFLFWDYLNPSAKMHEILADTTQAVLAPARLTGVTPVNGSNQLSVVNLPVGLSGFVEGTTSLTNWAPTQSFNSTNAAQSILVPASGPKQFYRLRFPFAWSWP